ncbi:MAG TPA: fused MFS/spermidine synthase [Burkholderiales bacterium]|nr:fused MFS/spermidine synthase [Burkholderiales bacterium]
MSSIPESNAQRALPLQFKAGNLTIVLIFSAAMFASALLLFVVQPIVGKLLLPKLGGTPQVWTTCMVFFQAMLFAGYLHAHYTSKLLGVRMQAALHLSLVIAAMIALPIGISAVPGVPDADRPVFWLITTLAISIGAPMFVISATAPLLQKWIAHTSHPAAKDPYFMYAASNGGSLLALLIYPTLVEPALNLTSQTWWWSAGYLGLAAMLGTCFWLFYRDYQHLPTQENVIGVPVALSNATRLRWLLLSFVPSSLLLGVTNYISTDVAAVPLFWIVPLALYLLTFILAFSSWQVIPHPTALRVQAMLLVMLTVTLLSPVLRGPAIAFPMHMAAFFFTALVCHRELALSRPQSRNLTEFYLWISFGGMLGGIFNALLAPAIFDRLYEYPLALMAACMLRPQLASSARHQRILDVLLPVSVIAAVVASDRALSTHATPTIHFIVSAAMLIALGCVLLNFTTRNLRLAISIGAAYFWLLWGYASGNVGDLIETDRSFFGVHKVFHQKDSGLNVLMHGTTIHGVQHRDPSQARTPISYYHAAGPFADVFRSLGLRLGERPVAVVGLGTGGLSCYGNAGSEWTYYEIDPLVEKIARNPDYFSFLRDCPPKVNVVLGDARISMRNAQDRKYGLIIVDAFSSDAIPTHLLTRDAIRDYLAKLSPDGVLALHISNRYLRLAPVVGNLAADAGLKGRIKRTEVSEILLASSAELAVLAREEAQLGELANDSSWAPLEPDASQRVWSDDYINILGAMKVFK